MQEKEAHHGKVVRNPDNPDSPDKSLRHNDLTLTATLTATLTNPDEPSPIDRLWARFGPRSLIQPGPPTIDPSPTDSIAPEAVEVSSTPPVDNDPRLDAELARILALLDSPTAHALAHTQARKRVLGHYADAARSRHITYDSMLFEYVAGVEALFARWREADAAKRDRIGHPRQTSTLHPLE